MHRLKTTLAVLAVLTFTSLAAPEQALGASLASVTAQAGGQTGKIVGFFESLFAGMQTIGIAIGVLMAGWAGIKIATGQRDGMEKLVYAGIGVFILLMAKPIIDLVQAATR